jgi:phosphoribosylanthranilate isomerase
MVKIKVCGICNFEDALVCQEAGCDALGFIFYRKSRRFISCRKAQRIIRRLSGRPLKVGVFVNAREKTIKNIANSLALDILQFHGDESPEFCDRFKGYKVIKAFRVKAKIDFKKVSRYKTFAHLFDTYAGSERGGTGRSFPWQLLNSVDKKGPLIFLSGGLNAGNVRRAIKTVRPDWVDVCSSVEIKPGKKSHGKVRDFIKAVRG